jgi:hypothetical protein
MSVKVVKHFEKVIIELNERDFLLLGAICGYLPAGNKATNAVFYEAEKHFGIDKVTNVFSKNTVVYFNDPEQFIDR